MDVDDIASPYTITGLTANTVYELQVAALHESSKEWSVLATGMPHGTAGLLEPPQKFAVQGSTLYGITLSWRTDDEGNPIGMANMMTMGSRSWRTSEPTIRSRRLLASEDPPEEPSVEYEVQYKVQGETWDDAESVTVSALQATIGDLEPSTTYRFRVRTLGDDGGASGWTETIEGTTATEAALEPTDPPERLARPSIEIGDEQLTVSWTAPGEDAPSIDTYDLDIALKGKGWKSGPAMRPGLTETAEVVDELTNGVHYAFRVRGVNALGEGSWSRTAYAIPVAGPPAFEEGDTPAVSVPAGEAMDPVTLPAANGGSGTLSYALSPALPDGLAFAATTRVLSGTPAAAADEGTWTLTATDEAEASATLAVTLTVTAPGTPPSYAGIDSPALEFLEGSAIDPVTLPAATGGNGALTYALAADLGNGLAFEAATRVISGTPAAPAATTTHTLTATDADGDTATLAFTLVVKADLQPTYAGVDSPALAFTEGEAIDPVTLPAATGGDGALTYTVSPTLAAGLAFDAASRTVSGTPETEADSATWTLAATDADNDTAELTFTIAVAPPPATRPENLEVVTSAQTAWKALDVAFDAPPAGSAWVAAKSQIRVLGMKPGAKRTGWRSFKTVTVEDGRAQASTASWMAIGRVYEVEVRWCEANGRTCSEASDMVYGASPASVPTDAGTSVTEPVSETALLLQWSISPIGGKKNLQAAYEIGYSTNTDAEAPETLLADVPAFGTKEAEIDGLESGTAYRLYVRSVIDWQGTRHFALDWASATATTPAGAESLARQQLQGELAKHARALLEDASTVIGQRFTAGGGGGGDALTALASVFGGAGGSACPRQVPLGDCLPQPGVGQLGLGQAGEPWDPERGYQPPMTTEGQGLGTLLQRLQTQNFSLSLNRTLLGETDDAPQPVQLALWGSGGTAFQGSQGQRFVGLDARLGTQWLTGVAVAQGGTAFQPVGGATGGELGSALTTVYPYLRGQLSDTLAVWSLAGWGWGDLTSRWQDPYRPGQTVTLDGALGLNLGLAGVEQPVYAGEGLSVAVVGDYGWSQLAVSGLAGGSLGAVVHRSRLGVTSDYASSDGALRGTLRLSGRLDGRAGERAQGAEMTGSVHYGLGRWTGGVTGHWYGATQALQLVLERQAAADGTGWTGRLAPGWGTAAGLGAGPGQGRRCWRRAAGSGVSREPRRCGSTGKWPGGCGWAKSGACWCDRLRTWAWRRRGSKCERGCNWRGRCG